MEIKPTWDGKLALSGNIYGTLEMGGPPNSAQPEAIFLIELDPDGGYLFGRALDFDGLSGMAMDGSGRITLAGGSLNPDRFMLAQFDGDGTLIEKLGGYELLNGYQFASVALRQRIAPATSIGPSTCASPPIRSGT